MEVGARMLRSTDAGSKGRWHGVSPCQNALEIQHFIAPSILKCPRPTSRSELGMDLRNGLLVPMDRPALVEIAQALR